jgi:hypothetical protein
VHLLSTKLQCQAKTEARWVLSGCRFCSLRFPRGFQVREHKQLAFWLLKWGGAFEALLSLESAANDGDSFTGALWGRAAAAAAYFASARRCSLCDPTRQHGDWSASPWLSVDKYQEESGARLEREKDQRYPKSPTSSAVGSSCSCFFHDIRTELQRGERIHLSITKRRCMVGSQPRGLFPVQTSAAVRSAKWFQNT